MHYIYVIQNMFNGKVYIGQSINPQKRCYSHTYQLTHNKHSNVKLQNDWNFYSKDVFINFVLGEYVDQAAVDEAEIFYIKWYKDLDLSYNLSEGGEERKFIHSEESKQKIRDKRALQVYSEESKKKMSDSHKGLPWSEKRREVHNLNPKTDEEKMETAKPLLKWIKENGPAMKGRKLSDYQIKLMSERNKGRIQSPEEIEKRRQSLKKTLTNNGKTIKIFGEEKLLVDWAKDSRCVVSKDVLYSRILTAKWEPEQAMITPVGTRIKYNGEKIECFGEYKTKVQWSMDTRCVCSRETLLSRINNNWEIEKALTTPIEKKYSHQKRRGIKDFLYKKDKTLND